MDRVAGSPTCSGDVSGENSGVGDLGLQTPAVLQNHQVRGSTLDDWDTLALQQSLGGRGHTSRQAQWLRIVERRLLRRRRSSPKLDEHLGAISGSELVVLARDSKSLVDANHGARPPQLGNTFKISHRRLLDAPR